jgi:hypothetical protein
MAGSFRIAALLMFALTAFIALAIYYKGQIQSVDIDFMNVFERLQKGNHRPKDKSGSDIFSENEGYNVTMDNATIYLAAEAARLSLNAQRKLKCPTTQTSKKFSEITKINYAKASLTPDGGWKYTLEIIIDNKSVFFAIVNHISNITYKPADNVAEFELQSIVPEPCNQHPSDQLAVSFRGKKWNRK